MTRSEPNAADGAGQVVPARLRRLPTRLLSQVAMHCDRIVVDGLAAEGARKWHFAVLAALDELGPASQAQLSDRTGIYRSDLVAVLNELAAQGDVERAPDPGDRRRNVITLTAPGRRRLHALDERVTALQDAALAPLTEREREQFTALLVRLLNHHGRSGPWT
jgi:DNA-binding MarR family transcriptional regulator